MNITISNTTDEPNKVNKTYTSLGQYAITHIGQVGHDVDMVNPVVTVYNTANIDLHSANYAYIDEWHRFYFIESIKVVDGGAVQLTLHVDVLMSFKSQLKECKAKMDRVTSGDNYLADPSRKLSVKENRTVIHFNEGAKIFNNANFTTLIITNGGGGYGKIPVASDTTSGGGAGHEF